jgi:hypothetical protein
MRSTAALDGAHARIRALGLTLMSYLIASTIVIVFPVPGLGESESHCEESKLKDTLTGQKL